MTQQRRTRSMTKTQRMTAQAVQIEGLERLFAPAADPADYADKLGEHMGRTPRPHPKPVGSITTALLHRDARLWIGDAATPRAAALNVLAALGKDRDELAEAMAVVGPILAELREQARRTEADPLAE